MLYISDSGSRLDNYPHHSHHSSCDRNANMVNKGEERTLVRCSIVGDAMVGKTATVLSFTHGSTMDYSPTIFENYAGNISHEGEDYTVSIFDLSGKHEHEDLRAFSYGDSQAFVVCYSAVDRQSFQNVKAFWVPEIRKHTKKKKPIILVATQGDVPNSTSYDMDLPVTSEEGSELAKDVDATTFIECAKLTKDSADEVFRNVVANIKTKKRKSSTSKFIQKIMGR